MRMCTRHTNWTCRNAARVCFLLHALLQIDITVQQGLLYSPTATLRASNSYEVLKQVYSKAKSFRNAFKTGAASSACSRSAGSLCSPFGQNMEQRAVVLMASSPQAFDARSGGSMGSFSAVAQAKDQGQCNSCVAFALLAAAQSAMACALRQDASSSISEHDFFFCKTVSPGEERTCASSWTMRQGVEALVGLQFAGKFPVTEGCMPWNPNDPSCSSYECEDVYNGLKEGTFSYVRLESTWEMQEHIRHWGSFATRLEIYSDFKPFFANNPAGIYPGHGPKATYITSHAIQVVGYDLESKPPSWLCKNSWGTGFAAGGFFRIAFGVDGVGSPDDTYGIKFRAKNPRPKPFNRLSPATQSGCYNYRALPTDFVSRVASVFGTTPSQILLDNTDRIRPDMLLTGMTIILCGISVPQQLAQQQGAGGKQQTAGGGGAGGPPSTRTATPMPAASHAVTKQQQQAVSPPPLQQQQSYDYEQDLPRQQPESPKQQPPTATATPQQPAATPVNIQYGLYTGQVACEGAHGSGLMNAQVTTTAGNSQGTFELELNSPYRNWLTSCDHQAKATCSRSNRGSCEQGQEAWACKYHTFIKWDVSCLLPARTRPTSVELCYTPGNFTMAEMKPPCQSFTGYVSLPR